MTLWWIEARRGTALTAGAIAGAALAALFLHDPGEWVGRWSASMMKVRSDAPFLLAVVAMSAAWQAGREHRRGTYEMLTHAARPRWQSILLTWGAVTAASVAGIGLSYGILALLFIARFASYTGTAWIAPLLVCVPAVAAATALGTVAGTLLRQRLVAPLVGIGVYVGVSYLQYAGTRGWLVPGTWSDGQTARPPVPVTLLQLVWFLAVTGSLLGLALSTWRRRLVAAVVPALVAAVAGTLLVGAPDPSGDRGATVTDVAASRPVCERFDAVRVCVARVNAFLLPSLGPGVAASLHRIAVLPDGPRTAVDYETGLYTHQRPGEVFFQAGYDVGLGGTESPAEVTDLLLGNVLQPLCESSTAMDSTYAAAQAWTAGARSLPGYQVPDPDGVRILSQLDALPPAVQRAWMTRYLRMVHDCDPRLAARLTQPEQTALWR